MEKSIQLAIEILKEEGFLLYHSEYVSETIGNELPENIIEGAKILIYEVNQNAVIISSSNCPLCGEDNSDKWNCTCLTEEQQKLYNQICERNKI